MRRAFALLARHPGRLVAVLALTIGAGLVEGAGLLLLIPLLAMVGIDVPVDGSVGRVAEVVVAAFDWIGLPVVLPAVLAVYVLAVTVQSGLRFLEQVRSTALVEDLKAELRETLFGAVAGADWPFHLRTRSSELLHVLNDEVFRAGDAASQALSLVTLGVTSLVYLAIAFWLSPPATAIAMATALLLVFVLRARAARSRDAGEAWSQAAEGVYFTASEFLAGVKTARSHADEERHTRAFAREARRLADSWVASARSYADVQFWFTTGAAVVLSLLVWVALDGLRLEAAALLVLIFIFLRLIPRFSSVQRGVQYLFNALPALDRIEAVLADARASAERGRGSDGGGAREPVAEGIRLEEIEFSYPEADTPALRSVSLEVPARRTTALVGPSGGGKTTLADLVIGLLEPTAGRIVVDGVDLAERDRTAWRRGIGYVPQDAFLFDDTVRLNLLPDPEADDARLWEALAAARLDEVVRGMPRGLDTVVGERGVRLSGGERQRLSLARALVRRPSLLILDEATSALDYENEALIRDALRALHGDATVVLITHRLALAGDADHVYVIEGGRVAQSGTPEELAVREGRFRDLSAAAR